MVVVVVVVAVAVVGVRSIEQGCVGWWLPFSFLRGERIRERGRESKDRRLLDQCRTLDVDFLGVWQSEGRLGLAGGQGGTIR